MEHQPTAPVGTRRSMAVIALLLAAVLALVVVAAVRSADRDWSFGSELGDLDTADVPNGWAPLIEDAAAEADIPAPVLAAQVEAESNWQTDAVSSAGAEGLAQFMPATWETYGQGGDPYDPEDAIDAQGRYMGDLLELAESSDIAGDPLELALAGYNAGFGAVERYQGVPPYPETENYIKSIRARTPAYALPT